MRLFSTRPVALALAAFALATVASAQSVKVDDALPVYKPVEGVSGNIKSVGPGYGLSQADEFRYDVLSRLTTARVNHINPITSTAFRVDLAYAYDSYGNALTRTITTSDALPVNRPLAVLVNPAAVSIHTRESAIVPFNTRAPSLIQVMPV